MGSDRRRPFDLNGPRAFAAFGIVLLHVSQCFRRYDHPHFEGGLVSVVCEAISVPSLMIFMIFAGMVQALGRQRIAGLGPYLHFVRGKFLRLMLPYFSVSLLSLVVKVIAPGDVIRVSEIPRYLSDLLLAPNGGPSAHLWFLYWLMGVFLIWPLLSLFVNRRTLPALLAVSFLVAIQPIPWPKSESGYGLLGLDDVVKYLPVFLFGYWYALNMLGKPRKYLRDICIAGICLGAWLVIDLGVAPPAGYPWQVLYRAAELVGKVSGGLFFFWLTGLIAGQLKSASRLIGSLAFHSYDIYLLHVAFIAHPLIFLLGKLHLGMILTYVSFVLASVVTYAIPVWIAKLIRRIPPLAFVILGVPMRKK